MELGNTERGHGGRDLHDGEAENERDGESLRDCVIRLTIGTRKSHDERHVQRHSETGNPECLLPAPRVDIVQAYGVRQRTNEAIYTSQERYHMPRLSQALV